MKQIIAMEQGNEKEIAMRVEATSLREETVVCSGGDW